MVAWKVIGKDLVRIFLGIISCAVISFLLARTLRRMYPYRIRLTGSWLIFWKPSEYKIVNGADYDGSEFVKIVLVIFMAANFGLTYAIMFA